MASDIDSWRFYLSISPLLASASSWPDLVQPRLTHLLLVMLVQYKCSFLPNYGKRTIDGMRGSRQFRQSGSV